MEVTRSPRSAPRRDGALQALGALALALLIAGCAASNSPGTGPDGSGSGGSSNGSGGTAGLDGGTTDGSATGTGGVSSGSGGKSSSGGQSSSGGATGSGGSSASGGFFGSGGSTGAGGSPAPRCYATIDPVSPPMLTGIEAGPNAKVRVRGGVVNYPNLQTPTYTWMVTSTTTGLKVPITAVDATHLSIVEFKVSEPGTFQIVASADDPKCDIAMRTATAVTAKPGFVFRTRASTFPVQEQRIDWSAGSSVWIDLQSGRQYAIGPLQANHSSNLLSSYLRLTDAGANFSLEGDTTHGPVMVTLLSGSVYNLLIVPADATFAPLLIPNAPPESLQGVPVDQGLHLGARTLDDRGAPIVGARMILKNGDLTSTVGVSDADGQMELWTRPGTVSAIVVPPADSGLPQARVDIASDGTGLIIPGNTSSYALTLTWAASTRGTLTVKVVGVDGTTAVSGARVRASLRASNTPVGVLTASSGGGDMGFSAMGSSNTELISDAQGQARFMALPAGTYDVTITPPVGLAGAITTLSALKLTATGLSRTVTLAQKVNLTGKLAPAPASQGTSITAIDTSSDASGSTTTTVAGSDGTFTLSVDPSRTYELIMQPRQDQALGRMAVRDVMVGATGTVLSSITLPPSVSVTGNVMSGGKPVAGAFVQVFCVSSSASCVDPTISLGDVTTASDGSFQVVLPDLTAAVVK